MDFATVILVLVAYLLRLHQLIPGGEWLFAQKYLMVASLAAMVFRGRGFDWKDLFRTPIDWAMILYLGFIVWHEDEHWDTFKEVWKLFAFYTVTVQALCNSRRLYLYMATWAGCLVVLALVTLDSAYGIDFSQSQGLLSQYQDRQCLNLSIYNNPNALGHTMILGLPMVFYAFFYKQGAMMKIISILMWTAVIIASVLTESKGAFIVGAIVTCAALWLGQRWIIRILMLGLVLSVGIGAFKALPRMEALQSADAMAADEGIWGRLIVWHTAREDLTADNEGCGWKQFLPFVTHVDAMGRMTVFQKGPHSSYIAVAAELGYVGLFFFLAVLLVSARTVIQFGHTNFDQERSRYLILIVVLGYCASAWMIERPYHIEYFFLAGICAALYRQRRLGEVELEQEGREASSSPSTIEEKKVINEYQSSLNQPDLCLVGESTSPEADLRESEERQPQLALSTPLLSSQLKPVVAGSSSVLVAKDPWPSVPVFALNEISTEQQGNESETPPEAPGDIFSPLRWKRLGIVDLALGLVTIKAILMIWDWVLNSFFYGA